METWRNEFLYVPFSIKQSVMRPLIFCFFSFCYLSTLAQGSNYFNPFELYSVKSINFVESCDFKEPVKQTLKLINDYRAQNGLQAVRLAPDMSLFATTFIEQLLEENVLYHSDLNGGTYSVENLYTEFGFGSIIGLNEKWYNEIAQQTFNSWRKSPGHNSNMLNPNITEIGLSFEIKTTQKNGSYSYVLDGVMMGR